ncbi:MAG: hypothetical protein JRJ02_02055 [Deltaproteobacteria bacterium]|nr:hypothetical protein [Deltaproteobacteria bacterium]MBW1861143.1 hypothetical protein [Deltaproteobacteria bacterium]
MKIESCLAEKILWPSNLSRALQVERVARELTRKMYCLTKKGRFPKDYELKKSRRCGTIGSLMRNIMAMEKSAKRLTNREP